MFIVFALFTLQIKETLKGANLLILLFRSRLKPSLKPLFSSMLSLHCEHNLCNLSYLDLLLSLFFCSTFIHFFNYHFHLFATQPSKALGFIHINFLIFSVLRMNKKHFTYMFYAKHESSIKIFIKCLC